MGTQLSLPPIEIMAAAANELAEQAREREDFTTMRAINKAALQLHEGTAPVPTIGGWLLESRTRPGMVHRISLRNGCSCEAGIHGKTTCWHVQLMAIVERSAEHYTMPALAKKEIDADLTARRQAAEAAMDELY
jgi:hypothetical protein